MIRSDCCYIDYNGDYSLDICEHPDNFKNRISPECRGCKLYKTVKQQRIEELKAELAVRKRALAELEGKKRK